MEGNGRSIRIPPRRNAVVIFFMACWWLFLTYTGLSINAQLGPDSRYDPLSQYLLSIFFWVGFLPWLHATCVLIWQTLGVETITILDDKLQRRLSVPFFFHGKSYDLAEVSNFRWLQRHAVWDSEPINSRTYGMRYGAIQFDNGAKVVTFAKGVDRQECEEIIDAIKFATDPANA